MTISTLINKQDSVEVVRDQIVAILVAEIASQQALATAASLDPLDWKVRVFAERATPWEVFPSKTSDKSPVVNVWLDSVTYDQSGSNIMERQKTQAVYNIDLYGYGSSEQAGAGFSSGDKTAAFEAQRGLRLVRNILMASEYTYLGLRGLVGKRWPQSVNTFQPQTDGHNVHHVVGARLSFAVMFNEFSPQYVPEEFDFLSIEVSRKEDGEVVLTADYDYTD